MQICSGIPRHHYINIWNNVSLWNSIVLSVLYSYKEYTWENKGMPLHFVPNKDTASIDLGIYMSAVGLLCVFWGTGVLRADLVNTSPETNPPSLKQLCYRGIRIPVSLPASLWTAGGNWRPCATCETWCMPHPHRARAQYRSLTPRCKATGPPTEPECHLYR